MTLRIVPKLYFVLKTTRFYYLNVFIIYEEWNKVIPTTCDTFAN